MGVSKSQGSSSDEDSEEVEEDGWQESGWDNQICDGASILYLSGCKDNETSIEIYTGGVLTTTLLDTLERGRRGDISVRRFLERIQREVEDYDMSPRLSCTDTFDIEESLSSRMDGIVIGESEDSSSESSNDDSWVAV